MVGKTVSIETEAEGVAVQSAEASARRTRRIRSSQGCEGRRLARRRCLAVRCAEAAKGGTQCRSSWTCIAG